MWRSLCCSAAMLAIFAGVLIAAADKDDSQQQRRPGDLVYILIEMSDCDEDGYGELQHIYDVLRKLDKNKDGKIDADEHKAMRHQLIEQRADDLIKELDTDKDGKISHTEAKGQLRKALERIDVNKDGFIDRQELIQAISEKPSINIRTPRPLPPSNKSQKRPDHP